MQISDVAIKAFSPDTQKLIPPQIPPL